jgi:hypothetical protein
MYLWHIRSFQMIIKAKQVLLMKRKLWENENLFNIYRVHIFFIFWRWGGSSTQPRMPTYVGVLRIPQMIWVWSATVEWYWQGKNEKLGEKEYISIKNICNCKKNNTYSSINILIINQSTATAYLRIRVTRIRVSRGFTVLPNTVEHGLPNCVATPWGGGKLDRN